MASATNVNGLTTPPNPGQTHWVSAWGNGNSASYTDSPTTIPTDATTGSVNKPVLLNWLVSGNEGTSFSGTSVVSSPTTPAYKPGAAMSPASLVAVTTTSTITVGGQPAQLLVGPNTVNSANADTDYVVAPSVALTAPAGSIPGLTTAATIGRYAYWIGDEGVKARTNLRDNYIQQSTTTAQDAARFYSYVLTQRSGVEVANRTNTFNPSNLIGTDYDPESTLIPKVITLEQLPLAGSTTTANTNLATAVKYRYHDFTTTSLGVLADSYAGGLKKNLSAALASGASTPASATSLFTPVNVGDYGLPTWGMLRAYAQTTMTGAAAISSAQQATAKLYPIITYAALGISVSRSSASPSQLSFHVFPVIALWNPYNFTLPDTTYEVGFGIRNGGKVSVLIDDNERAVLDLGGAVANASPAPAVSPAYFRFRISTGTIGAGRTPVYRINSSASSPPTYSTSTLVSLTQISISSSNLPGYATMPWTTTPTGLSDAELNGMMELRNVFTSGSYLEAALTPVNALSGVSTFTPTAAWYQAIQKVGFVAPGSPAPSGYPTPASSTVKLSTASSYPTTPTSLPYINLRIQAAFEGHHSNTYSQIGFPIAANSNQWFRWLANANLRAPVSTRTTVEENWMGTTYPGNTSYGGIVVNDSGAGNLINLLNVNLSSTSSFSNINSGLGHDIGTGSDAKIFALLPSEIPLLSIGELQHAPLSVIDAYPALALGNSLADYRLSRTATCASILRNPLTNSVDNYYDLSWHLNRSLLDRYFVSSAPATLTQAEIDAKAPLPNARMSYQPSSSGTSPTLAQINGASAYDQSAASLMVAGSFNVNSTSAQAWQAMLTGTNNLKPTSSATALNVIIPRSPAGSSNYPTYNNPNNSGKSYKYQGNRELAIRDNGPTGETANQKAARAADIAYAFSQNIVAEIKRRGPFISLGDFFNRRLIANETGLKGTLQAAIDATKPPAGTTAATTTTGPYGTAKPWISMNPAINNNGIANTASYYGSISQLPTGSAGAYDLDHVRGANYTPGVNESAPEQSTAANSVKFITQADLLSTIGPALSARSDTFIIRTYGEAQNPITGDVVGRAWCEAVVQRMPEYVDTISTPNPWSTATGTSNQTYGRRIKVVSFRWLSANDI
jgi:hypothetical protein